MADLNQSDRLLAGSQGFIDAVDAVSRQTEDRIHSPIDQSFD